MKKIPPQNKPIVEWVTISPNEAGQRIDNFLVKKLKGVPKSHLYRVIRKGEVRVNKGRISVSYKLNEGDSVRIPPIRYSEKATVSPEALAKLNQFSVLNTRILYEDAKLLVINKPSGLAVHGGSGVQLGLIEALRAQRSSHDYLELVHRLDRETSGCLLIAKKPSMLKSLHSMLREGEIEKSYLTFVEGDWKGPNRVEAPLQKNQLQGGERIVDVDSAGKPSTTDFKVMARSEFGTLMEAKPLTGRTHQIRVHAQFMGHPVAQDEKYGKRQFNSLMKEKGLLRLFLHASQLKFKMPGTDEFVILKADLDDDLKCFLKNINVEM
jgi:23S rRNA pseudouridine955/2504/2580 synthase